MRHRKKGTSLRKKTGPRKALLRNLAAQVIVYEKVKTTKVKAKTVQPIIENLITIGKGGVKNLTARRRLLAYLPTKKSVNKVLEVLGPKYKERKGGYTRIVKIGPRKGDGAEMAQIELT